MPKSAMLCPFLVLSKLGFAIILQPVAAGQLACWAQASEPNGSRLTTVPSSHLSRERSMSLTRPAGGKTLFHAVTENLLRVSPVIFFISHISSYQHS
jgi:hypothetical protein